MNKLDTVSNNLSTRINKKGELSIGYKIYDNS